VDTVVAHGRTWAKAIFPLWKPGDLIVCHAEQTLKVGFSKRQALHVGLVSEFHRPVYVLSGLYTETKTPRSKWLGQIPYWLILLTIIAGFFLIESRVDQAGTGWMEKTIFGLLFLIEVGLIWIWNLIME
jgi:hypothetical protein